MYTSSEILAGCGKNEFYLFDIENRNDVDEQEQIKYYCFEMQIKCFEAFLKHNSCHVNDFTFSFYYLCVVIHIDSLIHPSKNYNL